MKTNQIISLAMLALLAIITGVQVWAFVIAPALIAHELNDATARAKCISTHSAMYCDANGYK